MVKKQKVNGLMIILGLLFLAIIVYATPEILTLLLFNHSEQIAYISYGKNFTLYALSFVTVLIFLVCLYFIKHVILKFLISIVGLTVFFYMNFVGTNYSIHLDETYITFKPLFDTVEKYEWSKVSKVFHELPTDEFEEKYILEFQSGEHFEFTLTNKLPTHFRSSIDEKIMSLDASYEQY